MAQIFNIIKLLMKVEHITPKQIAKTTHLSDRTISSISNGYANPTTRTMCDIADYFDMPIDLIIGRNIDKYKIIEDGDHIRIEYSDPKNQKRLLFVLRCFQSMKE